MNKKSEISSGRGSSINKIFPGKTNILHGDPNIKIEKPYTIIQFPGGDVEVARCKDGRYWVHVATTDHGAIVGARIDASDRYCDDANSVIKAEIESGEVNHIAFLVSPRPD